MAGLIGKKIEMTRVIHGNAFVPVTLVSVSGLKVAQVKTVETDGYDAVVVKMTQEKKDIYREFPRTGALESVTKDTDVTLDMLEGITDVRITSVSKGKGFQ